MRDRVLRRLELRLFFHRERREARGERAAVEQFDEREAAAAPVRTTVAAMASWWGKGRDGAITTGSRRWRNDAGTKDKTPGQYQPTRPSQRPRRASWARATARIAASRARARGLPVLGARRGDGRRGTGLRFFGGVFPPRWRGTRRNSTPSPRR